MKRILKSTSLLFLILLFSASKNGFTQERINIKHDTKQIEGVWYATKGSKSYTMRIVREVVFFEEANTYIESLLGAIIYKNNDKIIRETKIDGLNSLIKFGVRAPSGRYKITFSDKERKIAGDGFITIDANNPQKATWNLYRDEMRNGINGWTETEFDIPTELEWTKIE